MLPQHSTESPVEEWRPVLLAGLKRLVAAYRHLMVLPTVRAGMDNPAVEELTGAYYHARAVIRRAEQAD